MKRNFFRICLLSGLVFVLGLLQPVSMSAQNTGLYSNRLDTLSIGERIALKTNAFDWLLLTPNIGLEFDLANRNWSKWSLGVYGRYNPSMTSPRVTYNVYDLKEVRGELRRYWRSPRYFAWYVGLFGSYEDYQIKFSRDGYKGKGWMGGISLGFTRRLYAYSNGSNLDFEFGLNVGALYTQNQKFHRDVNADCYVYEPMSDWHLVKYPMVNDLSMTFVYRFGPRIKDRYRNRIIIDDDYRNRVRDRQLERERIERERQIRNDSIQAARAEAKQLRAEEKKAQAELKAQLKAEKEALKAQQKAEKEALKVQRKEEKAAAKAAKAAAKEQAKEEKARQSYIQSADGKESVDLTKEERKAQRVAAKAAKKAEKEALKAAKQAEKEAERIAKEAEKTARKAAKAAEKEAAKASK